MATDLREKVQTTALSGADVCTDLLPRSFAFIEAVLSSAPLLVQRMH